MTVRHRLNWAWKCRSRESLASRAGTWTPSAKDYRTRFAQRALKPEEVRQELEATDAVLGDPDAVRLFVLAAASASAWHRAGPQAHEVFRVAVDPRLRRSARERSLRSASGQEWPVAGQFHFAHAGRRRIPWPQPPLRRRARAVPDGRGPHPPRAGAASRCGVIAPAPCRRLTTICCCACATCIEVRPARRFSRRKSW